MIHETDTITWVMEGKITDKDKFKQAMEALVPEIQKDPHTLVHYWMVSEDGQEFSIYQRYENEEAAINHLKTIMPQAKMLKEAVEMVRLKVYNPISEHLREKLAKKHPVFMQYFGGFMNRK